MNSMITEDTWEEFRNSGLLWWVNRALHLFGWALVFEFEDADREPLKVSRVYPARVKFRGFNSDVEMQGFINLTSYLEENSTTLLEEVKE